MARRKIDRFKALRDVAKRFESWAPARDVLTEVTSVPTIFPQINAGTRVGGWPLQRVALVHGPSNHGKTILCHGLGLSFLQRGHFYQFIDAEFTTDSKWLKALMGSQLDNPGFVAMRPESYESTVDAVTNGVETIAAARNDGDLPEDVTSLIVVDSIRKLVPQRLLKEIDKHDAASAKGSVDGMAGRAAMYKAALNSAWMDQLVPQLYHTNTTLVLIARESENTEATGMYDPKWKLTGGKAIVYDSSLVARVTRAAWVRKGKGESAQVVGERHCVDIHKTKVGGKDDKTIRTYFHTSNGALIPEGFDRARDVIEMARACGAFKLRGSHLEMVSTGEVWNGEHAAVKALTESPETLEMIEREVIQHYQPEVVDEAGV